MKELIKKIEEAEANGLVPNDLYQKQIDMLQKAHDEFLKEAQEKGYDINSNLKIAEIELQQFDAMRTIAKKMGETGDKYTKAIKDVRTRVLGKELVDEFFADEN